MENFLKNLGCPPINASSISVSQGFSCSQGELLKLQTPSVGSDDFLSAAPGLPECCMSYFHLEKFFYHNNISVFPVLNRL